MALAADGGAKDAGRPAGPPSKSDPNQPKANIWFLVIGLALLIGGLALTVHKAATRKTEEVVGTKGR